MYNTSLTQEYDSVIIANEQYFQLNLRYLGPPLATPHAKLYLLYKGKSILFDGEDVTPIDFTSIDLPFGALYETQLSPFVVRNVSSLLQLGIPELKYDEYQLFHFNDGYPYFIDTYGSAFIDHTRLVITYTNDNNPFYVATITPSTVWSGISKVGGYIGFFGILKFVLTLFNKPLFEEILRRKFERRLKEAQADTEKVDVKMVRE